MNDIITTVRWVCILTIIYAIPFNVHEGLILAASAFIVVDCALNILGVVFVINDDEFIDEYIGSVLNGKDFNVLQPTSMLIVDGTAILFIALEGYHEVSAIYGVSTILSIILSMRVYRRSCEN